MPRKKEKYFKIEMGEENTLSEYHNPFLNFITKEGNLRNAFEECDIYHILKERKNESDLEYIIKNINNPREKNIFTIGNNVLYIYEISLSKPLKSSDKYLYHIFDYNDNKETLCGFKEVLLYIKKKIKNKYAFLHYNGINERIVFSENEIENIITRMTANTHQISVNQINGKGEEDETILITPFKII